MMHGYGLVKKLCSELQEFMKKHDFSSIEDFRGYELFSSFKIPQVFGRNDSDFVLLFYVYKQDLA